MIHPNFVPVFKIVEKYFYISSDSASRTVLLAVSLKIIARHSKNRGKKPKQMKTSGSTLKNCVGELV